MIFQEKCCNHGWDIKVENTAITENISPLNIASIHDMAIATQLTLDLVAPDGTLNIWFGGISEAHGDNNLSPTLSRAWATTRPVT